MSHIGDRAITIADAKRGDIGNTSKHYAHSIFNQFGFDSVTIAPYMGSDAITPFIEDKTKTMYPGGFVKEPQVGIHDNVVSFDLNSLYPSIIMQYNMSPETIANGEITSFDIENVLTNLDEVLQH